MEKCFVFCINGTTPPPVTFATRRVVTYAPLVCLMLHHLSPSYCPFSDQFNETYTHTTTEKARATSLSSSSSSGEQTYWKLFFVVEENTGKILSSNGTPATSLRDADGWIPCFSAEGSSSFSVADVRFLFVTFLSLRAYFHSQPSPFFRFFFVEIISFWSSFAVILAPSMHDFYIFSVHIWGKVWIVVTLSLKFLIFWFTKM